MSQCLSSPWIKLYMSPSIAEGGSAFYFSKSSNERGTWFQAGPWLDATIDPQHFALYHDNNPGQTWIIALPRADLEHGTWVFWPIVDFSLLSSCEFMAAVSTDERSWDAWLADNGYRSFDDVPLGDTYHTYGYLTEEEFVKVLAGGPYRTVHDVSDVSDGEEQFNRYWKEHWAKDVAKGKTEGTTKAKSKARANERGRIQGTAKAIITSQGKAKAIDKSKGKAKAIDTSKGKAKAIGKSMGKAKAIAKSMGKAKTVQCDHVYWCFRGTNGTYTRITCRDCGLLIQHGPN